MSKKLKILACDDSLTIRRLVTMVLGREAIDLELAVTGQNGIEQARTGNPDLILLDYVLPDMSGKDVVESLASDFATSGVPVVIMSAKGASIADQFQNNPSVIDYLAKPFKPDALLSILAEHTDFEFSTQPTETVAVKTTEASKHKQEKRKRAARILYSCLKNELGQIPGYLDEMTGEDVGTQIARRILRGSVVDRITKGFSELLAANDTDGAPAAAPAEGSIPGLLQLTDGLILRRGNKFSSRAAGLPLTANERRLASLVDGRNTLGEIYRRTGLDHSGFSQALSSLSTAGLVLMSRRVNPREQYPQLPSHWLAIIDPDPAPLLSSLTTNLGSRSRAIEVRDLTSAEDLTAELDRERPMALFLSHWDAGPDIKHTLTTIRSHEDLLDLPIAVMLNQDDDALRESYLEAGANRVWAKPFHVDEVWHLILS